MYTVLAKIHIFHASLVKIIVMIMKLLFSLALVLVASNQAKAQCPFTFCAGLNNIADQSEVINPEAPAAQQETCADLL